jgi:hypothetical protein
MNVKEAPPGFEPGKKDLQSSALPLGYGADTKGGASGSRRMPPFRAGNRTRTGDPNLGKVVLYQLSYSRSGLWVRKLGKASGQVKRFGHKGIACS